MEEGSRRLGAWEYAKAAFPVPHLSVDPWELWPPMTSRNSRSSMWCLGVWVAARLFASWHIHHVRK